MLFITLLVTLAPSSLPYSENIYLGVNDSVENWNEILKEEVPKEENNPEIF